MNFLNLALDQAKLAVGLCFPNPAVGALIVKNNVVIGSRICWLSSLDFVIADDNTVYVERSKFNNRKGIFETKYYFWVSK